MVVGVIKMVGNHVQNTWVVRGIEPLTSRTTVSAHYQCATELTFQRGSAAEIYYRAVIACTVHIRFMGEIGLKVEVNIFE